MNIAIVEDEHDIAKMYRAILEAAGHDVCDADQHDLESVGDPDVAIVDLMMPDVAGITVLEWLVANRPSCRRVVASAMYQVPCDVSYLAHAVLTKPFGPDQLLQAVG